MVLMEGVPFLFQACTFPAPLQKCAGFCEGRPPWQKAILYIV